AQVLHHRTAEFQALHARVVEKLRRLLFTRGAVHLVTSSGTGLMEAAARNLIRDRALVVANGAFGERLHQIALANGKEADLVALGVDFLFAGVQKCLALPPGLSVVMASPRALERAKDLTGRGTYFDLVAMSDAAARNETPWTPSVPHIAALDFQLDRIERE